MDKKQRELVRFRLILPEELDVEIHRAEEGGFWANVKNIPGCNTQGENFFDLIEMINDAVLTYFEVPKRLQSNLGSYVPKLSQGAKEQILRERTEALVRKIIRSKRTLEFSRA